MMKHIMIAISIGIMYWLSGYIVTLNDILYGILALAIMPSVIGAILTVSFKHKLNILNIAICAIIVVLVKQILIIMRIVMVFLYDKSPINYIMNALIAFLYTVPFQVLFMLIGYAFMHRLMHKKTAISL